MTLLDAETLSIREMCDTYQVTARTLRLHAVLQPDFSGGVLEWQIHVK